MRETNRVLLVGLWTTLAVGCGGSGGRTTTITSGPTNTEAIRAGGGTMLSEVKIQPGIGDPEETPPSQSPSTMVRRALDAYQFDVLKCYTDLLPSQPGAEGKILVEATFQRGGVAGALALHVDSTSGLESMGTCMERVIRTIRIQGFEADDAKVLRPYTFANPPISFEISSPVVVSAAAPASTPAGRRPRRPRRPRRGRRGAAATPATPTPETTTTTTPTDTATATPFTPPPGNGFLKEPDVTAVFTGHMPELTKCYATLLETQRNAQGNGSLVLTIAGTGVVLEAGLNSTQPPLDAVNPCVVQAVKEWKFRASGTRTSITLPMQFTIAP